MQFTNFGNTGITVSRLCLGCMSYGGGDLPDWALGTKGWHVDKAGAREHFRVALDAWPALDEARAGIAATQHASPVLPGG